MRNKTGIYLISCRENDRVYVGSSVRVGKRWVEHKSSLRNNYHPNQHLQRSWNKYGEKTFTFELLMECKEEDLLRLEEEYINRYDSFHNGMNLTPKPTGGMRGYTHTEEAKKIMSEKKIGLRPSTAKFTDEEVKQIRQKYFEGERVSILAKKYQITRHTVRMLIQLKSYQDIVAPPEYHQMLEDLAEARKNGKRPRQSGWKHSEEFIDKFRAAVSKPSKNRKFSEEQVREIRRRKATGETCKVLAAEYGVNETSISKIARGIIYADIKEEGEL